MNPRLPPVCSLVCPRPEWPGRSRGRASQLLSDSGQVSSPGLRFPPTGGVCLPFQSALVLECRRWRWRPGRERPLLTPGFLLQECDSEDACLLRGGRTGAWPPNSLLHPIPWFSVSSEALCVIHGFGATSSLRMCRRFESESSGKADADRLFCFSRAGRQDDVSPRSLE